LKFTDFIVGFRFGHNREINNEKNENDDKNNSGYSPKY
jgi:hypothetical protein